MLLFLIFAMVIGAGTAIAITAICVRARRQTATSRHSALHKMAIKAPAGSRLATFEEDAQTWVEIGPSNEVLDRGRR